MMGYLEIQPDPHMEYAKPIYPVQHVNRAGRTMVEFLDGNRKAGTRAWWAIQVVDNWRAAHSFPLNSFHMTLKNRATSIYPSVLTAQRTKRLTSIARKLYDERKMKLSQMQDVGGCRAVMSNIKTVYDVRELYRSRRTAQTFLGEKDYIRSPKPTGYRGVHLKYKFSGRNKSEPWDGLKIEIQLRTPRQHRWATAVEAVDTFTKQALKANRGKQEWSRLFALMGSVYADQEKGPLVPGTPTDLQDVKSEITELNERFNFEQTLAHYRTIMPRMEAEKGAKYFLVTLDPVEMDVVIHGFKANQSQDANKAYTYYEMMAGTESSKQTVLVSVDSVRNLKRAYPNYFLDTQKFLQDLSSVTQSGSTARAG